jgi:F1F0 ATPase subunit 2
MGEFLRFAWTFVAGAMIGIVFFGGLWWTVRRAVELPIPALWFLGSSILRTGFALAGFWLVTGGNWRSVIACLAGFVAARLLVTWRTRVVPEPLAAPLPAREANDAA